MSDKIPFSFLIRPGERATLKQLARMSERSEGATLRWLIREKARELADAPRQVPTADAIKTQGVTQYANS